MNTLTSSLSVVVAELLTVFVVLYLLNRMSKRGVDVLFSTPVLKRYEETAARTSRNLRIILLVIGFFLSLGIAGGNAYLIQQGEDPLGFLIAQTELVGQEMWMALGVAALKVFGLWLATLMVLRLVQRVLAHFRSEAQAYEGIEANDESIEQFFGALRKLLSRAAWLAFLTMAAAIVSAPEALREALAVVLRVYVIVALGWLLFRAMDAIIATLDALAEKYASARDLLNYYSRLQVLVPLLRRVIEASIYLIVATLVAQQVEATLPLAVWGVRLLKITGYFFLSRVAIELARLLIEEALVSRPKLSEAQKKQRMTFVPLLQSIAKYGIYFTFVILSLTQLGVDTTPLLAGVGILGLAVSFGAQKLVSDLVAGFFILFEGHYHVGDQVLLNGIRGQVLAIDLRTTHLRHGKGQYVILRNSDIDKVENLCREFTYASLRIPVPYDCDLQLANKVIWEVGEEMRQEENSRIIGEMGLAGIFAFEDSCIILAAWCKLSEGGKWIVEGRIRQRIKERLSEVGIEMPFPQRVVTILPSKESLPASLPANLQAEELSNSVS